MLRYLLHHRRGWWSRLDGEHRAGVIFVCIEAALMVFLIGVCRGWWG